WPPCMNRIESLDEEDLEENFSHSSGPGGQNVNKVATRVTLVHRPSGLSVSVQDSRSQAKNRSLARERLLDLINKQREEKALAERQAREKKKRTIRPRPRGVKERILKSKKHRSETKRQRSGKFREG